MHKPLKCDEYPSFVGKKFVFRAVVRCDHVVFPPLELHNTNRGHVRGISAPF